MRGFKTRKIPRPATSREVIGFIRRAEGGAITLDMNAEVDAHEFAAIMEALSTTAKALGFTPGELSAAHMELMQAQRGLVLARPPE